jgi:hypothetical protein
MVMDARARTSSTLRLDMRGVDHLVNLTVNLTAHQAKDEFTITVDMHRSRHQFLTQ